MSMEWVVATLQINIHLAHFYDMQSTKLESCGSVEVKIRNREIGVNK